MPDFLRKFFRPDKRVSAMQRQDSLPHRQSALSRAVAWKDESPDGPASGLVAVRPKTRGLPSPIRAPQDRHRGKHSLNSWTDSSPSSCSRSSANRSSGRKKLLWSAGMMNAPIRAHWCSFVDKLFPSCCSRSNVNRSWIRAESEASRSVERPIRVPQDRHRGKHSCNSWTSSLFPLLPSVQSLFYSWTDSLRSFRSLNFSPFQLFHPFNRRPAPSQPANEVYS